MNSRAILSIVVILLMLVLGLIGWCDFFSNTEGYFQFVWYAWSWILTHPVHIIIAIVVIAVIYLVSQQIKR